MFAIVTTLLVFFTTLLFVYGFQKHNYWKNRNVPTISVLPILGNTLQLFNTYRWERIDKMYQVLKHKGYWGIYVGFSPELIISKPEFLREVMVKDADHFIDRRSVKFTAADEVFNEMLTVVEGEKWKRLRSVVTPTFTSGKIKAMFPHIVSKVDDLVEECRQQMAEKSFVDMNQLFKYYTMDVIGTCAFGIDSNCIANKEASMFIKSGKHLMSHDLKRFLKVLILVICPRLFKALGLEFRNKYMDFFVNVVNDTVAMRRVSKTRRGDFLDLMMEAFDESKLKTDTSKYPVTMTTVVAESLLFLLAGFDTTSNTLSFLIYLLAKNPEKQKILRKELQKIMESDEELNYHNVMEAHYLDCCLSESLRLYAPAHFIERKCTKSYRSASTGVEISEGTMVGIPTWSIHHDEDHWEDPYEFRPERFLPENKSKIKPFTYLPFGLGPRNCVGMRFAQLEAKIAISRIVLSFDIEIPPGFTALKLSKSMNTLRPDGTGVPLLLHQIPK